MVRVGDVFHHDSSCSAQTKFNSTGGYTYTWLCVHKCFIITYGKHSKIGVIIKMNVWNSESAEPSPSMFIINHFRIIIVESMHIMALPGNFKQKLLATTS